MNVRLDEICPLSLVAYNPVCSGYKPNRLKVRAVKHGGRNFEVSDDGDNKGTTAKTVVGPAGSLVAVDASRLEPRVEERDGYWVLKEKFRAGINPQEKVRFPIELSVVLSINCMLAYLFELIEKHVNNLQR
jgi:hypothetical protein